MHTTIQTFYIGMFLIKYTENLTWYCGLKATSLGQMCHYRETGIDVEALSNIQISTLLAKRMTS